MSDARKLVYKNPIKIINFGNENFPTLKEKIFTPFNEVVKGQKHTHANTKERLQNKSVNSNSTSNHFYKIQSENCENFIGPREYLPSSNGLALKKNSSKPQMSIMEHNEIPPAIHSIRNWQCGKLNQLIIVRLSWRSPT